MGSGGYEPRLPLTALFHRLDQPPGKISGKEKEQQQSGGDDPEKDGALSGTAVLQAVDGIEHQHVQVFALFSYSGVAGVIIRPSGRGEGKFRVADEIRSGGCRRLILILIDCGGLGV